MVKHSFKVGDKVKLKDGVDFSCCGKVLTIVGSECGGKFIPVTWKGIEWRYFPLYPDEIEHILRKGEQLMFNFMERN